MLALAAPRIVLVIGAAAVVGSELCGRLLADGDPIVGVRGFTRRGGAGRKLGFLSPSGSSGAGRPANWKA